MAIDDPIRLDGMANLELGFCFSVVGIGIFEPPILYIVACHN